MNILDKFAKEQNWYKLSDHKNFKEYIKPIQNNNGGILKVPYWFEDKLNEFVNEEIKKIKQEGRVEGMKQELKDTLTTLKAIDSELDRRNVDMMLKTLIKVKEKRLKELEKKVLNNEFCD